MSRRVQPVQDVCRPDLHARRVQITCADSLKVFAHVHTSRSDLCMQDVCKRETTARRLLRRSRAALHWISLAAGLEP
jgi:hypothetical protein